ncbi:MAG: CDP-diacylglycerol--glycerol-3-phosphate 3-phosphatidyltransferase, partial [Psychromonas sp.]|uniref:CDP-alcohol phosphatidyltransferase family protein n=1 Tax=Psychromonas sp. TaxID=1884585 RepID=UPI0039E299EC
MLTIYDLKPKFQDLLRPIVVALANKGVSANQVTWFAMLLSLLCGAVIYLSNGVFWSLLLLPFVLFIRMALNAIDGMLAREHNMKTKKGAMLNEMS